MSNNLNGKDYLGLWKHFEDKSTSVKSAMFNTITWLIGFAAALLAFIFANMADFDTETGVISLQMLVILASIAGLAICLYAFFTLGESSEHIIRNWDRADRCYDKVDWLSEIVPRKGEGGATEVKICKQLSYVVWFFITAFVGILVWSLMIF
jgi:hypothetical protein